jgi:nicotinamidase-related amidase
MTTALELIDLQNDYFTNAELARCRNDLLATCNRPIRAARDAGAAVVEVQTVHAHDRSTWALNMLDDEQGIAPEGTHGAHRLDGLLEPDLCLVKTRDSASHDTGLAARLSQRHVDRLVLAGISTESCIAATATDAYAHNLRVAPVDDATAPVERHLHDQTLALPRHQHRHEAVSANDVHFD